MFSVFHDLVEVSCDSVVAKSLRHNINEQCRTETVNPGNFKTSSRGGRGILYKKTMVNYPPSFFLMFIFSTVPGAMRCIVLQAR